MSSRIYEKLEEYQNNYKEELSIFLNKFPEAIEKDFVESELKLYQIYMNNTCLVKRKDGTNFSVLSVHRGTVQIKPILDKFYDPKGEFIKEVICTNMFYAFKKIKKYLENKSFKNNSISGKSYALYICVRQYLGLLDDFPKGKKEANLKELCASEGMKFSNIRTPYYAINSEGFKGAERKFSNTNVNEIMHFFVGNEKALDFLESIKL